MTAPAGLIQNTLETIAIHAGQNIDSIAHQHHQFTSGKNTILNAGHGISAFAHTQDLKTIAHQGQWIGQAQHNDAKLDAGQNISIRANGGKVVIQASDEVIIQAGDGTFAKLGNGQLILGTSGKATIHAASHSMTGPATESVTIPVFRNVQGQAPGRFRSTFARDQLMEHANHLEENAFILKMASTFGTDIPLNAYQALFQAAQGGLPEVEHELGYGGYAEFDHQTGKIHVSTSLVEAANQDDEMAQWDLMSALLKAYGEYLNFRLRYEWSSCGRPEGGGLFPNLDYALEHIVYQLGETTNIGEYQS